ncbi:TPA: hypothetical protein ACGUPM_002687 [Vibrio vulnificus]
MRNKIARRMIADVALKGRKLFWFGEPSEIYLAKTPQQMAEEFYDFESLNADDFGQLNHYQVLWRPLATEFSPGKRKGKPIYSKSGEVHPHYELQPMINGVYGDEDDIAQLCTSYS